MNDSIDRMGIFRRIQSLPVVESGAWTAIALTAFLCANGIWWGITEIWNADQMAFKNFFREGFLPFSPERFDKPPLLSYINFFFSMAPREVVVRGLEIITGEQYGDSLNFISVWLAKFLQLLFACGSVYLVWRIIANFGERSAALVCALLLATSAGFIVQAHLITTDLPLVFFMLLAFAYSQRIVLRGELRDYVLAGVLVGLTGAMKYNGLIVGIAIPVFHAFRSYEGRIVPVIFNWRLIAGVSTVPVGFLIGNPFALIEYRRFATDIAYLFATSQDFVGAGGDALQDSHLLSIVGNDLIGWPLFVVLAVAMPVSLFFAFRNGDRKTLASVCAGGLTCILYGLYLFPRSGVHVRWALPLVPFALIMSSMATARCRKASLGFCRMTVATLVLYGLVCSVWVGVRFAKDPRFAAIEWVAENVPPGSRLESTNYTPDWDKHRAVNVDNVDMPSVSGRRRLYEQQFAEKPRVLQMARQFERETRESLDWYTMESLRARGADYVVVSSLYYDRFMSGRLAELYPDLRQFFSILGSPDRSSGYSVAFHGQCCEPVPFLYPKSIMFVDNRITIYKRVE